MTGKIPSAFSTKGTGAILTRRFPASALPICASIQAGTYGGVAIESSSNGTSLTLRSGETE